MSEFPHTNPLAVLTDAQHAMALHLLAFADTTPADEAEARYELDETFPTEAPADRAFVALFFAEYRERVLMSLGVSDVRP